MNVIQKVSAQLSDYVARSDEDNTDLPCVPFKTLRWRAYYEWELPFVSKPPYLVEQRVAIAGPMAPPKAKPGHKLVIEHH